MLKLEATDRPKVVKWMKMARARWEVMVGDSDMNAARVETLAKLARQEQTLWTMLSQTRRRWVKKEVLTKGDDGKTTRQVVNEPVDEPLPANERLAVLTQIREVVKEQASMNGLNKDTIPLLMSDEQVPTAVRRSLDRQAQIMDVLTVMAGTLKERRERVVGEQQPVIEVEEAEMEEEEDEG